MKDKKHSQKEVTEFGHEEYSKEIMEVRTCAIEGKLLHDRCVIQIF